MPAHLLQEEMSSSYTTTTTTTITEPPARIVQNGEGNSEKHLLSKSQPGRVLMFFLLTTENATRMLKMRLTHSSILLKFKSIESQQLCLHDAKLIFFFLLFSSLSSRPIVLFFAFFLSPSFLFSLIASQTSSW
uniref:Stearoyl-CoA desaturase n=1 Tax=Myotis myotis TaxID=51298 RepID=A0A7J7TUM9_MYOMY|nr:stearoyl-CoA desaturase [Myotis myotis]